MYRNAARNLGNDKPKLGKEEVECPRAAVGIIA
jgi:hypothetical protein